MICSTLVDTLAWSFRNNNTTDTSQARQSDLQKNMNATPEENGRLVDTGMNPDTMDRRVVRENSAGPGGRPAGHIYEMDDASLQQMGSTEAKILRLEAGQHRLNAIRHLKDTDHIGMWPCQVYLDEFDDELLAEIRENRQDERAANTGVEVLYQLACLWRETLDPQLMASADRHAYQTKYDKLKNSKGDNSLSKVDTTLNKAVFGEQFKRLLAAYPAASVGLSNYDCNHFNTSLFPYVSHTTSQFESKRGS